MYRIADADHFKHGAVASPAFDWWVVSMQVLGAPFAGGWRALSLWLDGADAKWALDGSNLVPPPTSCEKMRARVVALTAMLEACTAETTQAAVEAAIEGVTMDSSL